ncbi:MAG: DUF3375 domain-containing protein [Rouxiella aceris]|uniref:DUF3375 domain-containing protein n=1 Tax=Rouxiella aceris TaxID=2703884 RepID=UPI00283FE414|nr:DUF3375 domain-containing protein [Rouxiella aceris]MDR3432087.1 DUF3375 domain-containing protein [Rouxiella aceris]
METTLKMLCQRLIAQRQQHPAWQLLAAQKAPILLSCLQPLFEFAHQGVEMAEAEQLLMEMLAEFDDSGHEQDPLQARRELREWIKRGLVVEREGKLIATDALQQVFRFIDGLHNRIMTSTASRLAMVQREIENLEMRLNPDPQSRARHIKNKIATLQHELEQVEAGDVPVLSAAQAIEGTRELYNLATGLRADFRRVEDSYREADRLLRQSIISEQYHRGEIVDTLLDSHDSLLNTTEGQVFHIFHQQLGRTVELDNMKQGLRNILANPLAEQALNAGQRNELRWLVTQLVRESAGVIRARARSEQDVKGYLKTGLAMEHHRVGQLLNALLEVSLHIDWERTELRAQPATLPLVGIPLGNLPLIERLRFKSVEVDDLQLLELHQQHINFDELDEEFWDSFNTLDRQALIRKTLLLLEERGAMTIGELSGHLSPTHDLETVILWLTMGREGGLTFGEQKEQLEIINRKGRTIRFCIPLVTMIAEALQDIEWEF